MSDSPAGNYCYSGQVANGVEHLLLSGKALVLAHGRQAWQPFGSYENASKQFERSVNAVQSMLTNIGTNITKKTS